MDSDKSDHLPKVFGFINSGRDTEWVIGLALAEDGACLSEHCSSSNSWARHDIQRMHAHEHAKHYPNGYRFEWVDDPLKHQGLMAAYEKNQAKREGQGVDVE